jgi:uncharacterized membrane protein YfcA
MVDFGFWQYLLVFLVGIVAAFLNAVAGGGSAISLPLLIFLGMPPSMANGTNRVGVLFGNFSSFWSLRKGGFYDAVLFKRIFLPTSIGALLGSYLGVDIPDAVFKFLVALVLIWVVIGVQLIPKQPTITKPFSPLTCWLAFFGIGFYGGFIQVGVGFILILAINHVTGLDLIRVNATKSLTSVIFILISIIVFAAGSKIDWRVAGVESVGCIIGGYWGSQFQMKKGEGFIRAFLTYTSLIMAAKLLYDSLF